MPDTGTGTTIAFGTSGFTAEIMSVNGNDISREDIETTHMGTTNYKTFIPGDLVDGGTLEVEFSLDPDDQPPVTAAAETITVTFPVPSGLSSGATYVFSGYVNSWSFTDAKEELMTGSMTIKVDGNTEPVWTDASA